MALDIELITAPGKYEIEKSMEEVERVLKEPSKYQINQHGPKSTKEIKYKQNNKYNRTQIK